MKINTDIIKLILVLGLLVFLFGFTNQRNADRKLAGVDIEFVDKEEMYVTYEAVNKLLIQNTGSSTSVAEEKLVLNKLENALNSNDKIRKAHVYLTVDGKLGAKIEQRTPIARVGGNKPFYIDSDGGMMSLSDVFSARVPLVTGVTNENIHDFYELAGFIYKDDFLKKHVIAITRSGNDFELKLRVDDFVVRLGNTKELDKKFFNFKAFYQKALKDKSLEKYREVNLKFNNQVVCTKK